MTHSGLPAFVRQVHFIEDRVTALERAVDAVQFATGAAWVAAYTPDADGVYTLGAAAGDMPFGDLDAVDQDDEAMVALRAARDAVDAPAGSVLAGALLLPFVAAGRIRGLLAVGSVPYAYTEAEREGLQDTATAVGLALEVLHARALSREAARWRERAEWAERELAVLHRVLDQPTPGWDAAGGSLAGNDSASASS
ncbi:MAG: GAF domain-containing protein [Candidatus Eremiobacteraeota bacterium]|nr:GAF domain-containing protein [Candidatus Eremiobacteraeota bacterium]